MGQAELSDVRNMWSGLSLCSVEFRGVSHGFDGLQIIYIAQHVHGALQTLLRSFISLTLSHTVGTPLGRCKQRFSRLALTTALSLLRGLRSPRRSACFAARAHHGAQLALWVREKLPGRRVPDEERQLSSHQGSSLLKSALPRPSLFISALSVALCALCHVAVA